MNHLTRASLAAVLICVCASAGRAQTTAASTDVYHVHFAKAVPGQATALADVLKKPDSRTPMPEHFVVLRHQQGDDWDYCVIQHLGPKATVDAASAAPDAGRDLRSWHTDTFVSGPAWPELAKALGIGDAASSTGGSVYAVAVWRAVPGHRDQLEKVLREPQPSKVPVSRVVLTHMEGGPWQYLAIDRWNSWQDFATDQASTGTATANDPWSRIREHGSYHHDTLADRIAPR